MAPRLRNSKGTNLPPMASELVGENEVASRQRNKVPLAKHEVSSRPRREMQEPNPMIQIAEMMKDLQQEIHLLKEGRTQEIRDNTPPLVNQERA